jgi:hypothetical protein
MTEIFWLATNTPLRIEVLTSFPLPLPTPIKKRGKNIDITYSPWGSHVLTLKIY